MHGVIQQIENHGTIVQVWIETDDHRLLPVNFDHRPFWHMVEARGPHNILGFGATFDESGEQPTLSFDDEAQREEGA